MNFREIYNRCNLPTESIKSFQEIFYECNIKPLFEQILKEAKLFLKKHIYFGKEMLNTPSISTKEWIISLLFSGGSIEGVLFYNDKDEKITAESWFELLLTELEKIKVDDKDINKTYGEIPAYKQKIEIIRKQYPLIIEFARKRGWKEGKTFNEKDIKIKKEEIRNDLNLSSIE